MNERAKFEVDIVIATCCVCRRERTYRPDNPPTSAKAFTQWIDTHVQPCPCGSSRFDIRARYGGEG